jgi:hypothetical protein
MGGVLSMAIATNSERIVELVCARTGPVSPSTLVAAVRRGSLSIVDVLMRYLPKRTVVDAEDNGETASMLDHLEALLVESGCSMLRLWHLAGALPHIPCVLVSLQLTTDDVLCAVCVSCVCQRSHSQ